MTRPPILTFFNNKGGVGNTSLVYHLGLMLGALGYRVLLADLDPQANLTAMCASEAQLFELWETRARQGGSTVFTCVEPLTDFGDVVDPSPLPVRPNVSLLPGDLRLSGIEDMFSQERDDALSQDPKRAIRVQSAFWRVALRAAARSEADLIVFDVGPNLGAINRAAILSTDYLVAPLAADLFSLIGLRNAGPKLAQWRREWRGRPQSLRLDFDVPTGEIDVLGYVVMQHAERLDRPVKSYRRWVDRIADEFARSMSLPENPSYDSYELGTVKHYGSLSPMAQAARKPMFELKPADGAVGSHIYSVERAYQAFEQLARTVAARIFPSPEGQISRGVSP